MERGEHAAPALVRPGAISALLAELMRGDDGARRSAWDDALESGAVIGRFELVRELGRGGFGVVWEARDAVLGRSVAFKALHGGASAAAQDERVLREAEVAARLSHPSIVTIHDVGRSEHGPYLVLELLRGRTLADRLEDGPVALREAVRIALEVAKGLAHAHAHGVVHRDLTPGNVFLCDEGQVKLLDLGMAQAFGRRKLEGGTPSYMAPEQARGAPEDERTDVFALGVLLYRMLANELPRAPAAELDVADAPALGTLVGRMLEPDPVKRPRDAGEVLPALTAVWGELAREPSASGVVRARRRHRTRLRAIVAALLLIAVAAALLTFRGRGERHADASVAVLPFTSVSRASDDAAFVDGMHLELITHLAKISGLRVIGPGSVAIYREGARDLRAIASALRVRVILEGSVQKAGQRVRVTAHLVDARTGHELWADRFDRELADLFEIQTDVATNIANALGTTLSASERRIIERVPTRNPEAHELYLRALHLWNRSVNVESDMAAAEALLDKAVRVDPSFAPAHALRGVLGVRSGEDAACASALSHASRAATLDPELAEAHAALAYHARFCKQDLASALRDFQLANRLAPRNAEILSMLGTTKRDVGLVEAGLADQRAAFALEPRSVLAAWDVAWGLAYVRSYPESEEVLDRVKEFAPGEPGTALLRALVQILHRGDRVGARATLAAVGGELPEDPYLGELLAFLPEESLAFVRAQRFGDPVVRLPFIPRPFVEARAHAALGDETAARTAWDAARAALERELGADADGFYRGWTRLLLARTYAGLDRAQDALDEAQRGRDAAAAEVERSAALLLTAEVAAAAARADVAVDALAKALDGPGMISAASLRVDPRFASLRGDPRFEALLARHSR